MAHTICKEEFELLYISDISDDCFEEVRVDSNRRKSVSLSNISVYSQEPITPSKLNWEQQFSNTQLFAAIAKHDLSDVESCLHYHANPNATCRTYRFTALHLAVVFNLKETLSQLLKYGAIPNNTDKYGLTPLHYAAWFNHEECINILIKYVDVEDRKQYINRGVEEMVDEINDELKDSLNHDCEKLEEKLPKGVEINSTPLHIACQNVNLRCVNILLEFESEVNLEDNRGLTALDVIGENLERRDIREDIQRDFVEIINLLKINGGKKSVHDYHWYYFTPIHAAVMLTSRDAIRTLVNSHLNPNRFDTFGQTPLHLAIIKQIVVSLQALLECTKHVYMIKNRNGLTPFQAAVEEQWIEGIGLLMKANVDITETASDGRTVLHIAAATGNIALLEELLKLNRIKKILNTKNHNGETPIYTAITDGGIDCVKLLLKNKVDLDIRLDGNINVIHKAAELGKADILEVLLDHEKRKNLILFDESDTLLHSCMTPLHMAAKNGHVDCVKRLLSRNSNYRKKTETLEYHGSLPIHLAANKDNAEVVKVFLDRDMELLNVKDNDLKTPLYYAALHGHRNTIEVLLKTGANLSTTYDDTTILDMIYKNICNPTLFLESIFDYFVSINDKVTPITDRNCLIKVDFDVLLAKEPGYNQMSILYNILHNCKGSGQKELIIHPLIECFLFLKWMKLRMFFWLFLVFYAIFVIFLTGFIICVFHHKKNEFYLSADMVFCFRIGVIISLSIVGMMDTLLISTNCKIIDIEVLIKWISLCCTIVVMIFARENHHEIWLRHIAAGAIISSWVELMFIIAKFPKCGYYVQMFCKVVLKVTKVMLLFSCFIFGFAMAFMIELQNVEAFWNPLSALMKTIAIMTAELDYNDIFLSKTKSEYITVVVYFLFILLATIALMNLMVGLAVNDIQELETKGVVDRLAAQIDFLHVFESNTLAKRLPRFLKRKFDNYKTVDKELSLYLSNPKHHLTKKLSLDLKEHIIKVAENNKNRELKVSNKDILVKLDKLDKMMVIIQNNLDYLSEKLSKLDKENN